MDKLINMLELSGYNRDETEFLREGFTSGFDIGYDGPQQRKSTAENIPFSVGNETELWNKIMKEVKLGRAAGPFESIPFEHFIQSPVGLLPKAGNQTRLILHLSYDCKRDGLKSLNHYTLREKCTVQYIDLDYAVSTYMDLSFKMFKEAEAETGNIQDRESLRRKWQNLVLQVGNA